MKTIQRRKTKPIYSGHVARESARFICFYVENEKQAEKWGRSFAMEIRDRSMHVLTGSSTGMEKLVQLTAVWHCVIG